MDQPSQIDPDVADLRAARLDDEAAFERLITPHRAGLQAHCYRMLGSAADAEDALQDALLRAWKGLPKFEGRSSLRSWLYRIATNVCLKAIERRPSRVLPVDFGPPSDPHDRPQAPLVEAAWLDPFPDAAVDAGLASPEARYEQRESVELAFIAALQHLPARQRAVLLLRDVLGFAPSEIAAALDATPASVYSTLQRAHAAVEERVPAHSQQATLRSLGDRRIRDLVRRWCEAWDAGDVPALAALLTDDATFSMPPRPGWYAGRDAIGAFLAAGPAVPPVPWRHVPARANGQLALAVYRSDRRGGRPVAYAIEVLRLDLDGRVADVVSFHLPDAFARLGLPRELGSQSGLAG
jgi:RNA polymerase sigma-70 factor (ECF subfamily)